MIVRGIRCICCDDFVFSRAHHDFRYCTCGKVAIDGGLDYCKISGDAGDWKVSEMDLPVTPSMMYDDWNLNKDKLGIIHKSVTRKSITGCRKPLHLSTSVKKSHVVTRKRGLTGKGRHK